MKNIIYFALSLLTILPGCIRSTKSKEIGIGVSYETIITDKYWKLLQLKGKTIAAVEGQVKEPGFFLDGKDKKISGNGGCNTFFGTYSLSEGSRISFSEIGSTKMACPDMDTESHFLQVLSETDNYALWGDTLVLYKGKMGPLAKLVIILYK
jgi:heat shock protein HslJ